MAKLGKQSIDKLDEIAKSVLSTIDPTYRDRHVLSAKDYALQQIVNRELDLVNGVSNNNIVDFIMSMDTRANGALYKNRINEAQIPLNYDNIFTERLQDIFSYFQDAYQNKYIQMNDLKLISRFVPSMGKAVKIMLSSICNSDDISDSMKRNIIFPSGTTEDDKKLILSTIEIAEKNLSLKRKLKNVYKNALVIGTYYVYAVPYNTIFDEFRMLDQAGYFQRMNLGFNPAQNTKILNQRGDRGFVLNNPSNNMIGKAIPRGIRKANESYAYEAVNEYTGYSDDYGVSVEIAEETYMQAFNDSKWSINDKKEIRTLIKDLDFSCHIHKTDILWDAMEAAKDLNSFKTYNNTFNKDFDPKNLVTPEAVVGIRGDASGNKKYRSPHMSNDPFTVSGLYVKYIDPKSVLPIKIFDQLVGYFYIRTTPSGKNKSVRNTRSLNTSIFANSKLSTNKKEEAINMIADVITTGIMMNFGPDFINSNANFKELIAECLLSNGIANNDFHIQFIPKDDMIPFKVNINEKDEGESMLADSLYPAKLLTELITAKLLNYFNKGGNKQVAHVHKGPIDANDDNQIQRTLRMLQESSISFNDLMSSSIVFSKFTRDANMQVPTDRNGQKIVEFEQIDGQEVDFDTPMENKLEKMAIQGTGIPDTFMDRIEDTGFSRQIISDHIELASTVSTYQSDLEDSTTTLYRKIIETSNLSDDQKVIGRNIEFKLPRPKALQNTNASQFINDSKSLATEIANALYGEQDQSDLTNKRRDRLIQKIIKDDLRYLEWTKYEALKEESELEVVENINLTKKGILSDAGMTDNEDYSAGGGGGADDMGFDGF